MADPAAVAAVLLEMPQGVCIDCIVLKTGIEPGGIRATFQRLAGSVRVVARPGRCCACSKRTMVFALASAALSLGDVVTSRLHPDRAGNVVNTAKIDSGYVSVRWRSPSGVLLQAVEEAVDGLALLRPRLEGGLEDASGQR
jgi:hypothetical protein